MPQKDAINRLPKCGVVILCAKNDELTEILAVIDGLPDGKFKRLAKIRGHDFPIYQYPTPQGEEILVVTRTGMGNINSASRTGFMLGKYVPSLIMFVGTAGSLHPDKCQVGDVVVPELGTVSLVYNKMVCEEDAAQFAKWNTRRNPADLHPSDVDGRRYALRRTTDKTQLSLTPASMQRIAETRDKKPSRPNLELLLEKPQGSERNPVLHFDKQIFSWEKVIATSHYRQKVSTEFESTIAVDMESYGFLMACEQFQGTTNPVDAIIVRGISDLSQGDKNDSYESGDNNMAVKNAAIIAMQIITRSYLET